MSFLRYPLPLLLPPPDPLPLPRRHLCCKPPLLDFFEPLLTTFLDFFHLLFFTPFYLPFFHFCVLCISISFTMAFRVQKLIRSVALCKSNSPFLA